MSESKLKDEINRLEDEYGMKKYALEMEYEPKIDALRLKCNHRYDDGTSAMKRMYQEAWCDICGEDL